MNHMFTSAKSHFQPDVTITKQLLQIQRRALRVLFPAHGAWAQAGKIFVQVTLLRRFKLFALDTSVKIAPRRTAGVFINSIGLLVIRHRVGIHRGKGLRWTPNCRICGLGSSARRSNASADLQVQPSSGSYPNLQGSPCLGVSSAVIDRSQQTQTVCESATPKGFQLQLGPV